MNTGVYYIISDTTLTYAQQMKALANLAESEIMMVNLKGTIYLQLSCS